MICYLCNKPIVYYIYLRIPFRSNGSMMTYCTKCVIKTTNITEDDDLRKDMYGTYVWIHKLTDKCIYSLLARNESVTSHLIKNFNSLLINQIRKKIGLN